MRTTDGRLLADLGDGIPAFITGNLELISTSSINENETTYAILPERINAVPYISSSIYNTSTPDIKPIQYNDPTRYHLYVDSQGVIKVAVGSSFTLKLVAKQPPIYNVENGVPTLYVDQTLLQYQWQKDGEPISSAADVSRPRSFILATGSNNQELVFNNVSPQFAGTYLCVASNDVGSTESEQITLEVYNPDIEDYFYRNLVPNPYGKDGVDGWQADQEFVVNRLSNSEFKNFSQPWSSNIFGYSVDMMYPRPYHINTHHIRNSNLAQDLMQEGYYFTRERFKYRVKDGKAICTAVCDIDLTPIQEYIQGSIWGIDGVRAIFGCYIGNAISKYKTTIINALITKRSTKYSLLPNIARLSVLNALLAGFPVKTENVSVKFQEFDNETPLLTTMSDGSKRPGVDMYDAWKNVVWSVTQQWPPVKVSEKSPGGTNEDRLLYVAINNLLHPSQEYLPTYGQYIDFQRNMIPKLDYRTNKLRITVHFEVWDSVLNITHKQHLDASDECFELPPWEWIPKPLVWPKTEEDYFKDPRNKDYNIGIDEWNKRTFGAEDSEPFSYATQLGLPRAMATGFNVVMIPIEKNYLSKLDYYTNNILTSTYWPLTYPKLVSGTSPATPIGSYMASLGDYETKTISINVQNRYNLRFQGKKTVGGFAANVDQENARADVGFTQIPGPTVTVNTPLLGSVQIQLQQQRVATRTTISTYLYNVSNSVVLPDVSEYPSSAAVSTYNSASYVWQHFAPSQDPDLNPNISGSEQVIVVYNTDAETVDDLYFAQVAGNIGSGLAKYINIVTDVPATFQTASMTKRDALQQFGFRLDLVGQNYGVPTTESLEGNILAAKRYKDWKTYQGEAGRVSVDVRPFYKWGSSNTTELNNKISKHIIYSENFQNNWSSGNYTSTYDPQESRLLITEPFFFTMSAAMEQGANYAYTRYESDDGFPETPGNVENVERPFALNIVNGLAASDAINWKATSSIPNKDYNGNNYNGDLLAYRNIVNDTVFRQTSNTSFPKYVRDGIEAHWEPGARVVRAGRGGTVSRVEIANIASYNNHKTPAAIIFPNKKKIIYLVYTYKDNYYNEQL